MTYLEEQKFKDVSPYDTINKINHILLSHELLPLVTWHNHINNIYSCSCSLVDCPSLNTNGKGTSAAFAQASALAEFLERLQSFYLFAPRQMNIIYNDDQNNSKKFVCLNDSSTHYFLPETIPTSTTGLAAGNSYPEAISQGLCELFERWCVTLFCKQQLYFHQELALPTTYAWILNKIPGTIKIYDISMNTNIPCVLVLYYMTGQCANQCGLSIGCAQSYNLAIERAFTELFQGININDCTFPFNILVNETNLLINLYDIYSTHSGLLPREFLSTFLNNHKPKNNNNQHIMYKSHADFICRFLTDVKPILGNIYVKFIGFLGFPTIILYCDNYELINYFYHNQGSLKEKINQQMPQYYLDAAFKYKNKAINTLLQQRLTQLLTTHQQQSGIDNKLLSQLLILNQQYTPDYSDLIKILGRDR